MNPDAKKTGGDPPQLYHFYHQLAELEPDAETGLVKAHLLPLGDYQFHFAEGAKHKLNITRERCEEIKRNFDAKVIGREVPVVLRHEEDAEGAAGWVQACRVEEDGLHVDFKPTDRGKSLIEKDRFRGVSASFWSRWTHPTTGETFKNVLWENTLTNFPKLPGAALQLSEGSLGLDLFRADGPEETEEPKMAEEQIEGTPPAEALEVATLQPLVTREELETLRAEIAELKQFREEQAVALAQREAESQLARLMAEMQSWRFPGNQQMSPATVRLLAEGAVGLDEEKRKLLLQTYRAHPLNLVGEAQVLTGEEEAPTTLKPEERTVLAQLGLTEEAYRQANQT